MELKESKYMEELEEYGYSDEEDYFKRKKPARKHEYEEVMTSFDCMMQPSREKEGMTRKICIHSPEVKYDNVVGHMTYIIECEPSFDGVQNICRRYSDFRWLRRMLKKRFYCTFVPPVPGKHPFGRTEDTFVEERRVDLQRFLNRLQESHHFRNTDLMQHFLTAPSSTWSKTTKILEKENTQKDWVLYKHLQKTHPQLDATELPEGAYGNQIVLVKEIWKRMLKKLEDVAMASLHLEVTYDRLSTSFAKLTESIQSLDVTERGFANYNPPSKPSNKTMACWCTFEQQRYRLFRNKFIRSVRHLYQDVKAALEQIEQLEKRRKKYKTTRNRANGWRVYNLTKLSGAQKLTKKSVYEKENAREHLAIFCSKIIMKDIAEVWSISKYRDSFNYYDNMILKIFSELKENLESLEKSPEEEPSIITSEYVEHSI